MSFFSQRRWQYQIAIWKQRLQFAIVWRGRYVANHELSLVIKFQLIDLRPRRRSLARGGSQAVARLREKRPAANRPAKKPTNGRKQTSRRSGFGYLYPDTRLIFTISIFHLALTYGRIFILSLFFILLYFILIQFKLFLFTHKKP